MKRFIGAGAAASRTTACMNNVVIDNFPACFAFTLGAEGGFSANGADPGNWTGGKVGVGTLLGTKFGLSAAAYPSTNIADLTEADAQAIYRRDYWARINGPSLPLAIAMVTFDAAVNSGVARGVMFLQGAVGVAQDGNLGPKTMAAVYRQAPNAVALEALAQRMNFSASLPEWNVFGLGWARRIISLAAIITKGVE